MAARTELSLTYNNMGNTCIYTNSFF